MATMAAATADEVFSHMRAFACSLACPSQSNIQHSFLSQTPFGMTQRYKQHSSICEYVFGWVSPSCVHIFLLPSWCCSIHTAFSRSFFCTGIELKRENETLVWYKQTRTTIRFWFCKKVFVVRLSEFFRSLLLYMAVVVVVFFLWLLPSLNTKCER